MTVSAEIQDEIEQIAGRINGRFGTFNSNPVTLIPFQRRAAWPNGNQLTDPWTRLFFSSSF